VLAYFCYCSVRGWDGPRVPAVQWYDSEWAEWPLRAPPLTIRCWVRLPRGHREQWTGSVMLYLALASVDEELVCKCQWIRVGLPASRRHTLY